MRRVAARAINAMPTDGVGPRSETQHDPLLLTLSVNGSGSTVGCVRTTNLTIHLPPLTSQPPGSNSQPSMSSCVKCNTI
jgi:hypothetical protein